MSENDQAFHDCFATPAGQKVLVELMLEFEFFGRIGPDGSDPATREAQRDVVSYILERTGANTDATQGAMRDGLIRHVQRINAIEQHRRAESEKTEPEI